MPALGCNVVSCIHYADKYCCKGKILVEGTTATNSDSTCCASYDERTEDTFKNKYETPDINLIVACEATNCIYNNKKKCEAEQIQIVGNNAHNVEQTECASFEMR